MPYLSVEKSLCDKFRCSDRDFTKFLIIFYTRGIFAHAWFLLRSQGPDFTYYFVFFFDFFHSKFRGNVFMIFFFVKMERNTVFFCLYRTRAFWMLDISLDVLRRTEDLRGDVRAFENRAQCLVGYVCIRFVYISRILKSTNIEFAIDEFLHAWQCKLSFGEVNVEMLQEQRRQRRMIDIYLVFARKEKVLWSRSLARACLNFSYGGILVLVRRRSFWGSSFFNSTIVSPLLSSKDIARMRFGRLPHPRVTTKETHTRIPQREASTIDRNETRETLVSF